MSYRIEGLRAERFAPLFALSGLELTKRGMPRIVADSETAYPCRVGLARFLARIGRA